MAANKTGITWQRIIWSIGLLVICYFLIVSAQAEAPTQPQVDQAIKKGVDYLKDQVDKGFPGIWCPDVYEELVLLTLKWGGCKEDEPQMQTLIKHAYDKRLIRTYTASAMAMALEAIDSDRHFDRIMDCAQFLVDHQCKNGQWEYSEEQKGLSARPLPPPKKKSGSGTIAAKRRVGLSIMAHKGAGSGDNSNTQFALLGLRAAERAGIVVPRETWSNAADWIIKKQRNDGGWEYDGKIIHGESYGSMTCASICGLAICQFYLKKDYKKDKNIEKGLQWLGQNFSVDKNPFFTPKGSPAFRLPQSTVWLYYYLYGLERVGSIMETQKIGEHNWYGEGSEYLIKSQKEDGRWEENAPNAVSDTCFAILFLTRATPPLKAVITPDKTDKPKEEEKPKEENK